VAPNPGDADLHVAVGADHVAIVELRRPPANYFDVELISSLADAFEGLDEDASCRAIVLQSQGRHFCAGADLTRPTLGTGADAQGWGARELYRAAARVVAAKTPVVAAVQGAAVGGGLGLACVADFRVASGTAWFSANFARIGLHHGFGLTVTLPLVVGHQRACDLLLTGRRVGADEALRIGLCDEVVAPEALGSAARARAAAIAAGAPLAVTAIRATMRADLVRRFSEATDHELDEQLRLRATRDFAEGVRAAAERREPWFEGR
jgi:enoyl-CoA hydratase/carnithine racemase